MKRCLPVLLGFVLVVAFGLAEGFWSNRWLLSNETEQAADRLRQVPLKFGEWEGKDQELDPRQVARAEMTGYLLRNYVHQKSGATVQVLLVCGRPGPTSVHTPDVCYQGAGYQQAKPSQRHEVKAEGLAADFWVGQFTKPGPTPDPLRIHWSWWAAGQWQAADNPRWQFARHAALYKLYVVRQLAKVDEPAAEDASVAFLADFLPVAQKSFTAAP